MTSIDDIKSRIDIVDLVSETVQLRRSGKSYTGFCPFHPNSRTPAFVVFPESGTWRCFGQCNEGGDIFKFVMKKENWDFPEALRYLAERAGVQLKPPTPEEQVAAEEHDELRSLLEEAVVFYRHQLLNTAPGKDALAYLRTKRGLKDETIEAFGLGYAPGGWELTTQHFKSKGFTEELLLACGLVSQSESGSVHDRFRHRVMFPIRDERGRMAGFGARILNPDDVPKFLNSPQTALFDKGRLLYGLDRARKAIRSDDQAVIVEGYLDVIAVHQAGFANAVSPMGTALTEQQLYLLKRFSRRIILALDSDAAGDKATLRGLQIARQAMDREQEIAFDARGLLRQEARLQADIRVSVLPGGLDPDEVVNRDPAEWERLLKEARPIVIHVMETLAAAQNVDDPKVKNEIAAQVLPLIEDVPSPIERDTYRQRLARLLRVNESALLEAGGQPAGWSRSGGRGRPASGRSGPAGRQGQSQSGGTQTGGLPVSPGLTTSSSMSTYLLEAHCLGVLLRRPDLLYQIDRGLQEARLNRLTVDDFQHADHQAMFRLLQQSIDQDIAEPFNFVINSLSLPMMELADGILARTTRLDPNDERVLEDLMRGILDLRRRRVRQEIEYMRFLFEEAQDQGDLLGTQYMQTLKRHNDLLSNLDQAMGKYTGRPANPR
jgi:DNA primase